MPDVCEVETLPGIDTPHRAVAQDRRYVSDGDARGHGRTECPAIEPGEMVVDYHNDRVSPHGRPVMIDGVPLMLAGRPARFHGVLPRSGVARRVAA